MTIVRALSALLASIALAAPALAQDRVVPGSQTQLRMSYAPIVQRVQPAVVNVYAAKAVPRNPMLDDPMFRRFFGVRLDHEGSGGQPALQRGAAGIEDGASSVRVKQPYEPLKKIIRHAARQASGQHPVVAWFRQLFHGRGERLQFPFRHHWPRFVHLEVVIAPGVGDHVTRARFVCNRHCPRHHAMRGHEPAEVRAIRTAQESDRKAFHAKLFECTRDVEALSAGVHPRLAGAQDFVKAHFRHGKGAVEAWIWGQGENTWGHGQPVVVLRSRAAGA